MSERLALLLTDVVDSTELNDRLGDDRMGPLWETHDRTARELMRAARTW
jgi:class 3 adenylate cyclase